HVRRSAGGKERTLVENVQTRVHTTCIAAWPHSDARRPRRVALRRTAVTIGYGTGPTTRAEPTDASADSRPRRLPRRAKHAARGRALEFRPQRATARSRSAPALMEPRPQHACGARAPGCAGGAGAVHLAAGLGRFSPRGRFVDGTDQR